MWKDVAGKAASLFFVLKHINYI